MSSSTAQSQTLSIELPTELSLRVTQQQFEAIALANRELKLECTAAGELILNPTTGGETGHRNIKIAYFLVKWIEEQGGYGIPFDSSTGFILPNGANRSPDAAWLKTNRWQALSKAEKTALSRCVLISSLSYGLRPTACRSYKTKCKNIWVMARN